MVLRRNKARHFFEMTLAVHKWSCQIGAGFGILGGGLTLSAAFNVADDIFFLGDKILQGGANFAGRRSIGTTGSTFGSTSTPTSRSPLQ